MPETIINDGIWKITITCSTVCPSIIELAGLDYLTSISDLNAAVPVSKVEFSKVGSLWKWEVKLIDNRKWEETMLIGNDLYTTKTTVEVGNKLDVAGTGWEHRELRTLRPLRETLIMAVLKWPNLTMLEAKKL